MRFQISIHVFVCANGHFIYSSSFILYKVKYHFILSFCCVFFFAQKMYFALLNVYKWRNFPCCCCCFVSYSILMFCLLEWKAIAFLKTNYANTTTDWKEKDVIFRRFYVGLFIRLFFSSIFLLIFMVYSCTAIPSAKFI